MKKDSLPACFENTAQRQGEKPAIRFFRNGIMESEISYFQLNRDANRLANTFRDMGIQKGDRVILFLPKSLFFVVSHLAIQKIGAIAVPLNPGFKKSEMSYLMGDAAAKLVISGTSQETLIKEIDPHAATLVIPAESRYQDLDFFQSASDLISPADIAPEDPGLLVYTSGTTGLPKGAVLTQKNLLHDSKNIIKTWEITDSDVLCHALPLFHVHGLGFALHTTLMAGSLVLMVDEFSPNHVLALLEKKNEPFPCTVFMAVPSMYARIINHVGEKRPAVDHVRLWTSGSAPLLEKDFQRIRRVFGKEPVEREGMSETGMNFSNPLNGARKPGSIGRPLPDLEVRIVNPKTFDDMPPGQVGEIWLKGPSITPGYWHKPKETALAFEKGWFRTGDLGKVDEDGYYYLTDRIKHIIISGGENISPKEVEMVINRVEDVVESAVVGLPDERWGEKIVAAVVPKPTATLKTVDIRQFCRKHLHRWKCPKEIVFTKALPKNTMGKVLKEEVKKLFKTGEAI